MLIRILTDNPGPTFTRNIDTKFVSTTKDLLKNGRDPSVQQILRETLDSLEAEKSYDEGLQPLLHMWQQIKGAKARLTPTNMAPQNFRVPPFNPSAPPVPPSEAGSSQRVFHRDQLPPPHELASRVEEAKNTAKILLQLVQSTPPEEVSQNELIKEFAERCQSAQRSMQGYINCDSPPPDDDTLQTLIEVNEQLSLAGSRHQRAILSARRAMGAASPPNDIGNGSAYLPPPPPPPPRKDAPQPQAQTQNAFDSIPSQPYNAFSQAAPQTYNAFSQSQPQSQSQISPQETQRTSAYGAGNFSPVSPVDGEETFDAPPGPPPSLTARLQSRTSPPPEAPHPGAIAASTDPFADPEEQGGQFHPMEPAHYGPPITTATHQTPSSPTYPEDAYAPTTHGQDRDSMYSTESPRRPGPGAYYNGATPSYVGRQASAANGLSMHGGGGLPTPRDDVVEVDSDSRVDRLANDTSRTGGPGEKHEVYRY